MNKLIKTFDNENYGFIRTTLSDKVPMFSFKDICKVLNIKDINAAKTTLNQNGVIVAEVPVEDTKQKITFVSEANMQKLYIKSCHDDIYGIIEWISTHVVPRTKMYGDYTVDTLMDDPEMIIKVLKENEELNLKVKLLDSKIKGEKFRVRTYQSLYGEKESVPLVFLAEYLKLNGITQSELMQILRGQEVIQPNDLPYQKHVDNGHFRIDEHRCTRNGELEIRQTPIVYRAGMNYIRKLLLKVAGENNG